MMKGAQTSSQHEDGLARVSNGKSAVPADARPTNERKLRRLMGSIVLTGPGPMDYEEKRRAEKAYSPLRLVFNFLEVDANYELDQPPAGIVGRRQILVSI